MPSPLYVLDPANAVELRPGALMPRMFISWLAMSDHSTLVTWKGRMRVPLTADEHAFIKRFRVWRSLWIFNRK